MGFSSISLQFLGLLVVVLAHFFHIQELLVQNSSSVLCTHTIHAPMLKAVPYRTPIHYIVYKCTVRPSPWRASQILCAYEEMKTCETLKESLTLDETFWKKKKKRCSPTFWYACQPLESVTLCKTTLIQVCGIKSTPNAKAIFFKLFYIQHLTTNQNKGWYRYKVQ